MGNVIISMKPNQEPIYWQHVRVQVARQASRWSCGTEGSLLYENLVEHEEWQTRLNELAPIYWLDSLDSVNQQPHSRQDLQ